MRCNSRCSSNFGRRRKRFSVDSFIRSAWPKRMWLATSAAICRVSSLEKCRRRQISSAMRTPNLDVSVKADAVRRHAKRRRLANIMQQRAPGQSARSTAAAVSPAAAGCESTRRPRDETAAAAPRRACGPPRAALPSAGRCCRAAQTPCRAWPSVSILVSSSRTRSALTC